MGERSHRDGPGGLETHVCDGVSAIEFERLSDVALCGHSYGGMPARGAADRVAEPVSMLL